MGHFQALRRSLRSLRSVLACKIFAKFALVLSSYPKGLNSGHGRSRKSLKNREINARKRKFGIIFLSFFLSIHLSLSTYLFLSIYCFPSFSSPQFKLSIYLYLSISLSILFSQIKQFAGITIITIIILIINII